MVKFPWQSDSPDEEAPEGPSAEADDALQTCECQDGTLRVYPDEVVIERVSRSKFETKHIPIDEIRDVTYARRLIISYIQIEQEGVDLDDASRFSTPVDENTLHFGRGMRDCIKRARDVIYERQADR